MSILLAKPAVPNHWVLDANILFSEWSLALLWVLAQHQKAQLYWTPIIEHECFRNLVRLKRLHADDAVGQQAHLAVRMGAQRLCGDYSTYLADVHAVDEKDRHVAAAALALRHQTEQPVGLLTWNLKDFPRRNLLKLGIVRYSVDELACEVAGSAAHAWHLMEASVQALATQLTNAPPKSHLTPFQLKASPLPICPEEWLLFLARNRLHRLARLVQRG